MKYAVRVSVVMPCHNVVKYVREAIGSILGQDFQDWELIVVDDASTDGTAAAIRTFADKRIKLFCLPANVGNYPARNFGIAKARGKYIAMFDADDVSLPGRLRVQYEFMEKHRDVGAIGGNYHLMDEQGDPLGLVDRSCTYPEFRTNLLADNYMLQSTIFLRSHLLKKYGIGYDERFRYAADYHFVFLCARSFRTFNIPNALVKYRMRNDGITGGRFLEQQKFAGQIRREIVSHYFGPHLDASDLDLTCMVLANAKTRDIGTARVESVLNKLLEINAEKKLFPQDRLHAVLHRAGFRFLRQHF